MVLEAGGVDQFGDEPVMYALVVGAVAPRSFHEGLTRVRVDTLQRGMDHHVFALALE